jgi:hypothetical protein
MESYYGFDLMFLILFKSFCLSELDLMAKDVTAVGRSIALGKNRY